MDEEPCNNFRPAASSSSMFECECGYLKGAHVIPRQQKITAPPPPRFNPQEEEEEDEEEVPYQSSRKEPQAYAPVRGRANQSVQALRAKFEPPPPTSQPPILLEFSSSTKASRFSNSTPPQNVFPNSSPFPTQNGFDDEQPRVQQQESPRQSASRLHPNRAQQFVQRAEASRQRQQVSSSSSHRPQRQQPNQDGEDMTTRPQSVQRRTGLNQAPPQQQSRRGGGQVNVPQRVPQSTHNSNSAQYRQARLFSNPRQDEEGGAGDYNDDDNDNESVISIDQLRKIARELKALVQNKSEWETITRLTAGVWEEIFRDENTLNRLLLGYQKIQVNFAEQVAEFERKIDQERFTISILGNSKAGKSTFLSCLIGKRLLYSKADVATMGLTFIRHSPNAEPVLYEASDLGERVGQPIAVGVIEVSEAMKSMNDSVRQKFKNLRAGVAVSCQNFLLETPIKFVTDQGFPPDLARRFQFVDTPGPDSSGNNGGVYRACWDAHESAHVTFCLMKTEYDTARNEEIIQHFAALRDGQGVDGSQNLTSEKARNPLFAVITSLDQTTPGDEHAQDEFRKRCQEFVSTCIGSNFPLSRCFAVSARRDLRAEIAEAFLRGEEVNFEEYESTDIPRDVLGVFGTWQEFENDRQAFDKLQFYRESSGMTALTDRLGDLIRHGSYPFMLRSWTRILQRELRPSIKLLEKILESYARILPFLETVLEQNTANDLVSFMAQELRARSRLGYDDTTPFDVEIFKVRYVQLVGECIDPKTLRLNMEQLQDHARQLQGFINELNNRTKKLVNELRVIHSKF